MNTRILSWVVYRVMMLAITATAISMFSSDASGQSSSGFLTDPVTGIVYRKVSKTIEAPVVETKVHSSDQTVYRPQTVTETRPHFRTLYCPVVQYKMEPRVYGRWNPFRQPTVGYQHVPHTSWEARNEVVHRTKTRTEWVAERRTVEVPTRVVTMQRQHKFEYEPVGRVSQPSAGPAGANDAFAARLQPLNSSAVFEPFNGSPYSAPRIASSTVGGAYGSSSRSVTQGGMRPTDLAPIPPGAVMPPSGSATGIANSRPLPIYR